MHKGVKTVGKAQTYLWFFLLITVASAHAAEYTGRVVLNGSGIPGAAVTVSRGDQQYSTVTDGHGRYFFSELVDGTWLIQVEMQAFSSIRQDITIGSETAAGQWELMILPMDKIPGIKATLPPIAASSTPDSETTKAKTRVRIKNLNKGIVPSPTNTQTPFQLTEVKVIDAGLSARTGANPSAVNSESEIFGYLRSADLRQRAADGFLINGSANNSASSNFALARSFGNNRGIIRSLYHGSAGFSINHSALNARPYSLSGIDTPKVAHNRMQGMFSMDGPFRIPLLVRNGPTFHISYQFVRNQDIRTQSVLVPTLEERNGDLSQASGPIIDPASGRPFAGNRIPSDRISPQAKSLLNLYPLPNIIGSTRYNYQVPVIGETHQDSVYANLSRSVGRRDQLSGTFSFQHSRGENPTLLGFIDTNRSTGTNLSANWLHRFTLHLVGTLDYRFSRQSNRTIPFFENRENISGIAGIEGNNQEPVNWGPPNLIFFSGLASLSDSVPSYNHRQSSTLKVSGFWNYGGHTATFGSEYIRHQTNLLSQQNPRGSFTFTGASTLGPAQGIMPSGARNDFAGFLLGIPDAVSIAFGNADKYFRSSDYTAYIADEWQTGRSFTLNAGMRWKYGAPITELYDRLVNLDIAPGFTTVAPVTANDPTGPITGADYPDSLVKPYKLAFQPRIGFAWKPLATSSMVVRGGYGIYYNTSPYPSIAMELAQQSPLSKSLSRQNTAADPLTLENGFNASPNVETNTFAVDPDLRIGHVHILQLSLQIDLPAATQITVTYEGSRGKKALQEILPNTYPAGAVNPCPSCPSGFRYRTSNGTSTRNAGTVQLRRRLRNGFTATMQYTFSKSIDDAAPGAAGTTGTVFMAQNWIDPGGERALSSFDQRHAAVIQFQHTTGMGIKGGTLLDGWRGELFKEWTFSTRITANSGLRLTPVYVSTVPGTGVTGPLRPDSTGADINDPPPGLHLNPAAFKAPEPGCWGNAGRNSITGPSRFNLNASLARTFRTSDQTSLTLSVNVTNLLNHPTFTSWNTTLGSARFGLPAAVESMRTVQTNIRWRF